MIPYAYLHPCAMPLLSIYRASYTYTQRTCSTNGRVFCPLTDQGAQHMRDETTSNKLGKSPYLYPLLLLYKCKSADQQQAH